MVNARSYLRVTGWAELTRWIGGFIQRCARCDQGVGCGGRHMSVNSGPWGKVIRRVTEKPKRR